MLTKKPKNIDEYIASFPKDIQRILEKMRTTIKKAAPDAEETISYQMPAFKFKGILVYFAALKKHIGFYPTSSPMVVFKKELSPYKHSRGAIQFPLDKPIPYDFVSKIVKYRVKENEAREKGKKSSAGRSKSA
jgi:uncharacterized protein YdhG (YjbR/CyaY superfamily)